MSVTNNSITLAEIIEQAHQTAKDKGWWDEPHRDDLALIALMHSELSEAVECVRRDEKHLWIDESKGGKPEGVAAEFADVILRIADCCAFYGIPLETALKLKLEYNKTRPHRHGGKKA